MATSSAYSALYVANTDANTVAVVGVEGGAPQEVEVGAEPTRVARAGEMVFVTLRAARQVQVLQEAGGSLTPVTTIDVGAEPFGVVATEDGSKVYVASSMSNRVDEIDVASLSIERSWTVPDEPRWLALHPSKEALYAASAMNGTLSYIDLGKDNKVEQVTMPVATTFLGSSEVTLAQRITGDPAVSPNGHYLVVPTLYIDNKTPIDTENPPISGGYYGGGRFNPSAAVFEVAADGNPVGEVRLLSLSNRVANGYPASITFETSSELFFATIEGGAAVLAVPVKEQDRRDSFFDIAFGSGSSTFGGFSSPASQGFTVGAGPRSIAITGEKAYVYSFLDQQIRQLNPAPVVNALLDRDRRSTFGGQEQTTSKLQTLPALPLPQNVKVGRELFYATNDEGMSAGFSGLSCATCHFDGRNDGLTWNFNKGKRQTPSLAGPVSLTEPVRWEGDRVTVAEDARRTSEDAMGGTGKSDLDFEDIAAFVDWTRDVDHELKGLRTDAIQRGKEIFERADVGCASCHSGERYTDNQSYNMFDMPQVQTRSLVGVTATAPYLHDGSAATLREVLERARDGSMGNTSSLSEQEMEDLVAFLRSL